jgi:hypothetical protein
MKLIPLIKKINSIKKDISENQTLISTILPLFKYLSWDIFDENQVIFEDVTSTKKRVDITFLFNRGARFIVEAKRLTHKLSIKDFEQLTLYINSDENVNYGILTNGVDYWIADNKKDGLDNKNIYRFNIFELTECDLDILKIFFTYGAKHSLDNLNRYIEYIKTGLEFGDKKCIKILQLGNSNYEEIEPPPPKIEVFHSEPIQDKLDFEEPIPPTNKEKEIEISKKKKVEVQKINTNNRTRDNFDDIIDLTDGEFDSKQEETTINIININSNEDCLTQIQADEIIEPKQGKEIEYFNLIEKSKSKIYLNGKYHIITGTNFSDTVLRIMRYLFDSLSNYPVLFSKVIDNFDFIVSADNRTVQSAKYEMIFKNYYFNVNINNYTKIVDIEKLLKFIDDNFE